MTFLALVPSIFTNVKQYGAVGDGSTDDTSAISAALTAISSTGGTLFFPPGTYITGNQTLLPNVEIVGAGLGNTTIKLKNGANTDLFSAQTSSINLSASFGVGIVGTLLNFSIRSLTLDGNKANQSSGTSYPLRFYGYNFILRDLNITAGYTGGTLIDWNGGDITSPSVEMESLIETCKFHDNNGIGLQFGGPHDSRMHNVMSFVNGSHNFHLAPNATGTLITNSHGYASPNTTGICCWVVESPGNQFTNCVAEGAYYTNLALIGADNSWVGGNIYATSPNWTSAVGIQLGQAAGQTPIPGQILQSAGVTTALQAVGLVIDTKISECRGGALNVQNEGRCSISANIYQTVGTAVVGSAISTNDYCMLNIKGLTSDGTVAKAGGLQIESDATAALTVYNKNGTQLFQVSGGTASTTVGGVGINTPVNTGIALVINTAADANKGLVIFANSGTQSAPLIDIQNSSFADVFTVDKTGNTMHAGMISTGQSASAPALATSGTITTASIGEARVAPTGNVTGIIMQAGTVAGQECVVTNESAFTVTFAAVGTSNVADGVSAVIAANRCMFFKWDSSVSKWYHS
jgi:hypothetical protein